MLRAYWLVSKRRLLSADYFLLGEETMLMATPTSPTTLPQPWCLPPRGLAMFHGECNAPRLSHYFMPRLALEGKRILFIDGANCADPRLMARLAERRGLPFAQFNRQIMLARAFTCFQLTELIRRVPQFLAEFPAQVVMVTAFPELYFDEDVRQPDAVAAFQQALEHLRFSPPSAAVAIFSGAARFQPPPGRTRFFAQTCAAATELWKFQADENQHLSLERMEMGSLKLGNQKLEARNS